MFGKHPKREKYLWRWFNMEDFNISQPNLLWTTLDITPGVSQKETPGIPILFGPAPIETIKINPYFL
jgi:hypothetical protein